jgi:4-hydroxy-tetrahydrodipicolinate reductase
MGSLAGEAVENAGDMELAARYAPGRGFDDRHLVGGCDVVVEFSPADAVMDNLRVWREHPCQVVVGSSGFDEDRLGELRRLWSGAATRCLVVPNFSIGAVLMMRLAESASRHFVTAEIVELHHDRKADAPSGTALATAARLHPQGQREVESVELVPGARGAQSGPVWVHSVRMPGLLAHQEVLLGNPGEVLTIRHDTTDRSAFVPGILLAIRGVTDLPEGVSVGLETLGSF